MKGFSHSQRTKEVPFENRCCLSPSYTQALFIIDFLGYFPSKVVSPPDGPDPDSFPNMGSQSHCQAQPRWQDSAAGSCPVGVGGGGEVKAYLLQLVCALESFLLLSALPT